MSVRLDSDRLTITVGKDDIITAGLLFLFALLIFAITALAMWDDPATIGGTAVPGDLACQEDEVITFIDTDTLGCLHYQEVRP